MCQLQVIINIELPQMLRGFSVPGIINNEFSFHIKSDALAYTVGIAEITKQAMSLTANTLNGLQIHTLLPGYYISLFIKYLPSAGVFEKNIASVEA